MGKAALIARFTAHDGRRDQGVEAMLRNFAGLELEAQTEVYALHLDARDPNTLWFYEL